MRWMFEKYDGIRGFWNPEKKVFYSRQGNIFPIPKQIIDSMPSDIFLDGELWYSIYFVRKRYFIHYFCLTKVWERQFSRSNEDSDKNE